MARAHGLFNVVNGLWPLLHMRSFEAVSGRKTDRWLVRTVAGLLVTIGVAQLRAGRSPDAVAQARLTGVGTALTLVAVDVYYVGTGRIPRVYLLDAAMEVGWLAAWLARPPDEQAGLMAARPGRSAGRSRRRRAIRR